MGKELAVAFLREAEEILGKPKLRLEDVIQACEKLYKAAEEAVKGLARTYASDIFREAEDRGRWTVTMLERAQRRISRKLGDGVREGWDVAYYLHVAGFHEAKPDAEAVKSRLKPIKNLVNMSVEG